MKIFSSNKFGTRAILFLAICPVLSAADIQTNQLPPVAAVKISFDHDIRPILETSCLRCHGPEKPKSHFRLDNRDAALKGGNENDDDIVPGDSSKSMLTHYVARQVPDFEMPPNDKGIPLTTEQVGLLRAWIDQGANWTTTNQPPQTTLTFAPTLRWFEVSGNESKFRELEGVNAGFSGGAEEFSFTQQVNPDEKISVTGHAIVPNNDFELKYAVDRTDTGFIHAGFDEWRKYYNDTGGYNPTVTPPEFSVNDNLYVDYGDAWIDFGLTLPQQPQVVVGYEYQFANGNKSMLDWGWVVNNNPQIPQDAIKAIYPATQSVDEQTHILKLNVTHDFDDWHLEDSARGEFYSANNTSYEKWISSPPPLLSNIYNTQDNYHSTLGMNTLMLEKQIRDWWFVSGGFYYSQLSGSDFFNQTTTVLPSSANTLSSQEITLNRESEIFSVASLFTPLTYLTFSLGSQNEWTRENGFGNSVPDLELGGLTPAGSNANLFKSSQNANLRFTKIPFTVVFADARFDQESVNQFQQEDPAEFANQTDATNYRYDFQTGFNMSPWRWFALNAQYQYQSSDTDYNYPIDVVYPGIDGNSSVSNGYPGFILDRKIKTDQFETKLELRPANWIKTTLTFQIAGTDYSSTTDPAFGLDLTSGQNISLPGGPILDGRYDAQTYGLGVTLTPIQRLYFSETFTYSRSRVTTASNNDPSIVPYDGNVYTFTTTATYAFNVKTSLQAAYAFSQANYGQDNALAGNPSGIDFTRNRVIVGLTRKLTKHLSGALHYEFSEYTEPTSGGANNFTAQGIFASFAYKWQ